MIGDIVGIVIATVAVIGIVAAMIGWFYKRGADERELTVAVKQNTAATDKLSAHMDKIADTLTSHGEKLAEHDARLRAGGL